jgi:membrane fusion protein (multidrug efflux system)
METQQNPEKPKSKKRMIPVILAVIVITAAVIGIRKYTFAMHHEETDDAQIEGNMTPVVARVSGYVDKVMFQDNQKVQTGDVLVKIDDRDLQIKVTQAEASLESARAGVSVTQATITSVASGIATAQANLDAAQIRVWKSTEDFKRAQKLLADKAITQQQFDAAKAEKETAESMLEVAKKQLAAAQAQTQASSEQTNVAGSSVKLRQADVDYAKLQLSYASVTAPFSGIVSKKNVQPGQYIQAGTPLFSLVSDSDIWIIANFKETQLERMAPGQTVDIKVDAYSDIAFKGYVESFSPATGAKFSLLPPDNATGNFVKVVQRVPVKIRIQADRAMLAKLHPGLSVKVTVNLDERVETGTEKPLTGSK